PASSSRWRSRSSRSRTSRSAWRSSTRSSPRPGLRSRGATRAPGCSAQAARGNLRRGVQTAAAVLLAALVAGLRRVPLPFDGSAPPLGLGITGSTRPAAVAVALWRQLGDHPTLAIEALVLAAAAVALPYARGRGPWAAAF